MFDPAKHNLDPVTGATAADLDAMIETLKDGFQLGPDSTPLLTGALAITGRVSGMPKADIALHFAKAGNALAWDNVPGPFAQPTPFDPARHNLNADEEATARDLDTVYESIKDGFQAGADIAPILGSAMAIAGRVNGMNRKQITLHFAKAANAVAWDNLT